jgi:hypothetical protein
VEFHLNGLSQHAVHISGFRCEDGAIAAELNAVSVFDIGFSYGRLVQMFQPDVPFKRTTNKQTNKQTNSVAFSPQANYTD